MLILFLLFISQTVCRFLYNYLNFAETRESQKETGSPETVVLRYFAKIRLRVWVDVLAFMKTSRSIISAAWLRRLPVLHLRSSNQVVYLGSSSPKGDGNTHPGSGFALRCFQRLSFLDVAIQRCSGRNNWRTSGQAISVLSYWR